MIRRATAPHSRRMGIIQSTPYEGGRVTEGEFVQCCHCQFTALWVPGLEKGWGLCWRCNDWHCSKPSCVKDCVPIRQWLDNRREGKPDNHKPIRVSPGGVILGDK